MSWDPQQPQQPQQQPQQPQQPQYGQPPQPQYGQQQWPQYPPQYQQQYQPQYRPQWGPPQQPQWAPPPPRRGKGLLIGLIGGLVVLLVATAGVVLWLTNRNDNTPTSQTSPTATTTTTTPTASPTEEPSGPQEQLDKVTTALTSAGFTCSDSLSEPVVVVRCFPNPVLSDGDQRVILQADLEAITYAHLEVNSYDQPAATAKIWKTALTALTGALLPPADAAAIRRSSTTISWGTAKLSTKDNRYDLTLIAKGKMQKFVLDGQTKVTVPAAAKAARAKAFTCTGPSQYGVTSCRKNQGTEVYSVDMFSVCGTKLAVKGYCEEIGSNAAWVHGYAAFGRQVDQPLYNRITAHFQLVADVALGRSSAAVHDWLTRNLDGKPHRTDLEGLHLAILPGNGGRGHAGSNPNIVALEISGIRAY